MTYVFADKKGENIKKSYLDPYLALNNRGNKFELCIVKDGKTIQVLPTKIIFVKWAIACAQRVLKTFEHKYPNDKKPRQAIEAAKRWLKANKDLERYEAEAKEAADAVDLENEEDLEYEEDYAAFAATYAADAAAGTTIDAVYAAVNAADAAIASVNNEENEIMWQKNKFWEIVVDPYFELAKINYHRNFSRLGLKTTVPFEDLGPQIRKY
jgi:hypothetical protein